ncbi:MAG: OmpA family protein [Bacteroidaceae bacterium]|nr:OmpA family protein [Bacteroidaceae bacterium]
MKKTKIMSLALCFALILSGCASMNNTTKGGLLGGGGGAALGAVVGGIIGKGKGAAIGAGIGAAVGTGAGVLIGKKMDKAAAEAAAIEGAQVEQVTDQNGLQAVKVTFDSGILFGTGAATLSSSAKASLSKFANDVLKQNADMDVDIFGYTDNQGWKNSTAEQSKQKNLNLSQERAQSVSTYLMSCGITSAQIKGVQGLGEENPIADNSTATGRQENRRVEVYMYASPEMIQQAEAGTLQ